MGTVLLRGFQNRGYKNKSVVNKLRKKKELGIDYLSKEIFRKSFQKSGTFDLEITSQEGLLLKPPTKSPRHSAVSSELISL